MQARAHKSEFRRLAAGLAFCALVLMCAVTSATAADDAVVTGGAPELDAGFRLLYELKFAEARAQFALWRAAHPDDPLGDASLAASYLFEELYAKGALTSEFFLDDKRLLGGVAGKVDEKNKAAFTAANQRAREMSQRRLKTNPKDTDALFALTIATGMQADYASLIEKRQFESLRLVREAEGYGKTLLALRPDAADAYLALGAANYIIGCLPGYKRAFLWVGGIHGDRKGGMDQLAKAASQGHYLKPFAKIFLALAAMREKQYPLARTQLAALTAEFPGQPLFAREFAKVNHTLGGVPSSP